jgi:hypothetical protein
MPGARRTTRLIAAATTGLGALAALAAPGSAGAAVPRFTKPLLLTVDPGTGGYEPGIVVDKFGNVVVTAHKANHSLVVSPDKNSPTATRSMSWVWWSGNGGKTFKDMPGSTPIAEQNAEFGDEGDLAWDATGHIYFVDTNVTDISFTRWKASGRGELALEKTTPVNGMGEPVDDRPWVAAHGDGVVMYLGNEGNTNTYPAGRPPLGGNGEAANGPGRFTAYMSYDHGDTFDHVGYTFKDSGWCRPIADPRRGSKNFCVLCSDDKDTHYAFVSTDDAHHWKRYVMGTYKSSSWINGAVGPDGTLYALYHDVDPDDARINRLKLYTSKTGGKTWTKTDITQGRPGQIAYSWMSVSAKGTLGVAYYYSPDKADRDWNIWAGTAKPGKKFTFGLVSPGVQLAPDGSQPLGDFFQVAFSPDDKLNVVWTQNADLATTSGFNTDIYYAKQL